MTSEGLLNPTDWAADDEFLLATQRRAKVKGRIFLAFVVLVYLCIGALSDAPEPLPEGSLWRAVAKCALAIGMLFEFFIDHTCMPPAAKGDEIFPLLQTVGVPVFLTFQILSFQTTHQFVSAMAELSLLGPVQLKGLYYVSHVFAVFMSTVGVVLTLLFLKFNWFEQKWQVEVKDKFERRGWKKFGMRYGTLTLLSHIPSMPIAFLEIMTMDAAFFKRCIPSITVDLCAVAIYTAVYLSWIHLWWAVSDFKSWPYPFLHDFDTCLKRILFGVAIFVGVGLVMLGMSGLADLITSF